MDDENLYLTNADSVVIAMRRSDGAVQWEQDTLKRRGLTAPAIDGDALVVGDFEGYLHWLDKATGEIVARQKTDGERITNTPVTSDAGVFVQTDSGKLLAFRSKRDRVATLDNAGSGRRIAEPGDGAPGESAIRRMRPYASVVRLSAHPDRRPLVTSHHASRHRAGRPSQRRQVDAVQSSDRHPRRAGRGSAGADARSQLRLRQDRGRFPISSSIPAAWSSTRKASSN